jgi:arginyl-tRNA synthetase
MLFNPEESVSLEGDTGPFIQYSHARIAAIRRRAQEEGVATLTDFSAVGVLHRAEQEMIQELGRYGSVVTDAAKNLSPAVIAQYAYDLARAYNRFYVVDELRIFNNPDKDAVKQAFRVALSVRTGEFIKQSLRLLGIQAPERM